jgi:hydroxymethylglutaryl-CoA lyase
MAAYLAGCRRFDSALTGLGGCPFAGDNLVGNIATEDVVAALEANGVQTGVTVAALAEARDLTQKLRLKYADDHGGVVAHA